VSTGVLLATNEKIMGCIEDNKNVKKIYNQNNNLLIYSI
jgi:hypothetical protein